MGISHTGCTLPFAAFLEDDDAVAKKIDYLDFGEKIGDWEAVKDNIDVDGFVGSGFQFEEEEVVLGYEDCMTLAGLLLCSNSKESLIKFAKNAGLIIDPSYIGTDVKMVQSG